MVKQIILVLSLIIGLLACGETSTRSESYKVFDKEYCDTLKARGAVDALINDDNILLYGVYRGEITANPDEVAKLWFEDASSMGIQELKGCQIVEFPEVKIIGAFYKLD